MVVFAVTLALVGYPLSALERNHARALDNVQGKLGRLSAQLQAEDQQLAAQDKGSRSLGTRLNKLESAALDANSHTVGKTAATVKKSVVTVIAGGAQGSAFTVSSGAGTSQLVTNFHVVAELWTNGVRSVKVRIADATWPGRITRVNEADDLALITVGAEFPALKIHQATPSVGDPVLAVGSPLGLEGSVSSGIVSALRKSTAGA